ncbi:MAG TPA: hypothetical protein VL285_14035 [Bryobacteraceae bacterium]|nr:hypothetical protein [Bryobacteraceae bacterium]
MPENRSSGLIAEGFTPPASKTEFLERAGSWFLNSGIQETSGGVARYYLADVHQNRAVSTEITGYAVSTLTYLYAATGKVQYLDAARSAGAFLTKIAWNGPAAVFPFELTVDPLAYFFDSGIIVRGLLSLWRMTAEREFLDVAKACGRSMSDWFGAGNGEYHPVVRIAGKTPEPRANRWSRMPGCYQLKAALAWDDLYKITGDSDFLKWFEELLNHSLKTHSSFLPGPEEDHVMDRLHAYCYFLEGLLARSERADVAAVLVEGVARVSKHLREVRSQFARSDVYAQLLRVRLALESAGIASVDRLDASTEAECLSSFQLSDQNPRLTGGFYFGRRGSELQPHINPVSTGFCLQALMMWRQYLDGELRFSLDSLI